MKNLFDTEAFSEINKRLETLTPESPAQWGKMNVAQMLAHCSATIEVASGKIKAKRILLGRIIGPFFKSTFFNDRPLAKSTPTHPTFIMTEKKDFASEMARLKKNILDFHSGGPSNVTTEPHSFFGKLTPDEWGIGMYKHLIHHLSQFGA